MRYRLRLREHTALRQLAHVATLCICVATSNFIATESAVAQTAGDEIALGDKATIARQPLQALTHFDAALKTEPQNYAALWKAAGASIDLGEGEANQKRRDSLYNSGSALARRALEVDSNGADGNFTMARALGRTALSVGPRDRIKYGTEVRMRALKALAADPKHPGAMHVMGAWNAEIMRLNSVTRFLAKTLLGGAIFSTASWASAEKYLTESVAIDPTRTVHRLDLARVYRDTDRNAEARSAYEAALKCPLVDANDDMYRKQAADELRALK
ncbi:MAG: hypothetical protein ABJB66_04045 [Gemmatimonadaceae bacterium]